MFDSRKQKPNCQFSEEIVSYIYDEMNSADAEIFETHLENCHRCIDEVAAFSTISNSINEWRAEEFANLSTPKIEIPYQTKDAAAVEVPPVTAPATILDKIRRVFDLSPFIVKTATAFAVLALVFGFVWFVAFNKQHEVQMADRETPQQNERLSDSKDTLDVKQVESTPDQIVETKTPDLNTGTDDNVIEEPLKPVKVKNVPPKKVEPKTNIAKSVKKPKQVPVQDIKIKDKNIDQKTELQEAPRLTTYAVEDTEDDDLRLTDLFADVDSDK